jgi:hypothetical protein
MDINNNKLCLCVFLLIVIYLVFFNDSTEHFMNSALPVNWKQIAETQCNFLKDEIKKIDELLVTCSNVNNNDNKLSINNRITCREANDMNINLSREQQHWCNSAQDLPSKDAEFMGTQGQSDLINQHDINLSFVPNKDINMEYVKTVLSNVKPEDDKYKYFNSIGILGFSNELDDKYASIESQK